MHRSTLKYLGLISQIGITIVTAVFIGAAIGVYLDRFLQTQIIFTFLFIFIGAASGLWTAYQILMKISVEDMDK